ncbi:hypothetical protein MC885_015874, partial [Smutsia gigantea]
MRQRSRGINAGLILLLSQIFHVGINNIPPVTLATLAVNIWLFLTPLKSLDSTCISVETCYQHKDWLRLLFSPLHHANDWHLYFNMASMLWKGICLERRLGSKCFACIVTTFSLLTGLVYLLLESALAEFTGEPGFRKNCAVGFSGVLFALKVLNNHYCPGGFVNVLGFPVPNRFACWAELVAIHFTSPGTWILLERREVQEDSGRKISFCCCSFKTGAFILPLVGVTVGCTTLSENILLGLY